MDLMTSKLNEGRTAAPRRNVGSAQRIVNERFTCVRITNGFSTNKQTSGGTLFLNRDSDEKLFLYCDRKGEYHSDARCGDVYTVTGMYDENTHAELGTNNIFKTTRTTLTKEVLFFHDETVMDTIKNPEGPTVMYKIFTDEDEVNTDDEDYPAWVQWKLKR